MPIFDYRCTDCNSFYDVFHKGKELIEDIICPACGSKSYKKLLSVPSISISTSSSGGDYCGGSSCESGGCCDGSCGLN